MRTTASAAIRSPSAVRTAVIRSPRRSSPATSVPKRNRAPASRAASVIAVGTACIPPRGNQTPLTVSM